MERRPSNSISVPGVIGTCIGFASGSPAQDLAHGVVALVARAADHGHALEVAAALARLDRERDHEVGLVEVPGQLVAVAHHREVQRAERVGVAEETLAPEQHAHEFEQRIPLVERAQQARRPGSGRRPRR